MKKSAFSLAECLVVVFVLLVIAAIVFPIFARARENSKRYACLSNLKQIGLGFMQYSRDYDEQMSRTDSSPYKWATFGGYKLTHWAMVLQPYCKNFAIFQCPSERNAKGTDYYYNPFVAGRKMWEIWDPAVVVLATEGVDRSDCNNAVAAGPQKGGATPPPYGRHLEGSNYLFYDAHVKWLPMSNAPSVEDLTGGFTFRGKLRKVSPYALYQTVPKNYGKVAKTSRASK